MIIEYILVITALLWVLFASLSDIKTREVPDWLSYSLIAIGLGLRGINSIYLKDVWFFLYGLIGLTIMFGFGMLMYYTKQWGGGDSKLIMGLGAVFGSNIDTIFNPVIDFPFLAILVFNILLIGGFYGLFYGFILAIKNRKNFLKEIKKEKLSEIKLAFISSIIIIILLSIISYKLIPYWILFGAGIMFLSLVLLFMKIVEKCCMYKYISVDKLTEGDWVAEDIIVKGKLICSKKDLELTKEQISKLRNLKIKNVFVKEGIPFVPSFLIGLLITLIWGNLLAYVI